jgi:hypothetical protein
LINGGGGAGGGEGGKGEGGGQGEFLEHSASFSRMKGLSLQT